MKMDWIVEKGLWTDTDGRFRDEKDAEGRGKERTSQFKESNDDYSMKSFAIAGGCGPSKPLQPLQAEGESRAGQG
jgi:hypothetical protein